MVEAYVTMGMFIFMIAYPLMVDLFNEYKKGE